MDFLEIAVTIICSLIIPLIIFFFDKLKQEIRELRQKLYSVEYRLGELHGKMDVILRSLNLDPPDKKERK